MYAQSITKLCNTVTLQTSPRTKTVSSSDGPCSSARMAWQCSRVFSWIIFVWFVKTANKKANFAYFCQKKTAEGSDKKMPNRKPGAPSSSVLNISRTLMQMPVLTLMTTSQRGLEWRIGFPCHTYIVYNSRGLLVSLISALLESKIKQHKNFEQKHA